MPSYFKRRWNETRGGDEYDSWGESWWYFEVESDGSVLRQVEHYDSGAVLRYGGHHAEDEYGSLADQPLTLSDPEWQAIDETEFQRMWEALGTINVAQ